MSNFKVFAQERLESYSREHLYLRGNLQLDMFFDKVDLVCIWNRLWLSAAATDTIILSAVIMNNHLHIVALFKDKVGRSRFMHHFRLSITQFHNRRYEREGMLGTRKYGHGPLNDIEDTMDCICYHIRNVRHHGIMSDFMNYKFSTAKFVFGLAGNVPGGSDGQKPTSGMEGLNGQKPTSGSGINPEECYTCKSLPENLAKAYLPTYLTLPEGWLMTKEGMVVPPKEIFRADLVEGLFETKEKYLETLSRRTRREDNDEDEPVARKRLETSKAQTLDEKVVEFVKENSRIPIPMMSPTQKMEAVYITKEAFPKVSFKCLQRIFGIPESTLRYRIKTLHRNG